jgi:nitroreductase
MNLYAGHKSDDVIDYLLRRRSVKADQLAAPGPSALDIETILKAATRVPDHGKMCPWYFLIFEGEDRATAGHVIADIYARKNPEEPADKIEKEANRLMRAPLVIGVVSRARRGKNPIWEQVLSAGAVCMNVLLAANALGYGANWLTEWYAYDPDVKTALGLDRRDHVAGFIHIGTPVSEPEERERPLLADIVTRWSGKTGILKGDSADREKFDFPPPGFDFTDL